MAEYRAGTELSNIQLQMAEIKKSIEDRKKKEADTRAGVVAGVKFGKNIYDYWLADQKVQAQNLVNERVSTDTGFTGQKYQHKTDMGITGRATASGQNRVELTDEFIKHGEDLTAEARKSASDAMFQQEFDEETQASLDEIINEIDANDPDILPGTKNIIDPNVSDPDDIATLYNQQQGGEPLTMDWDTATASVGTSDTFVDPAIAARDTQVKTGDIVDDFVKTDTTDILTDVDAAVTDTGATMDIGGEEYGMVGDKVMDLAADKAGKMAADILANPGGAKNVTDIVSHVDKAGKIANIAKGASTAIAGVGTAMGAADLAQNWDNYSDSDKAAKTISTVGSAISLIPGGAIVGVPLAIAGSLWDAFND